MRLSCLTNLSGTHILFLSFYFFNRLDFVSMMRGRHIIGRYFLCGSIGVGVLECTVY